MNRLVLVSGSSCPDLAQRIAQSLGEELVDAGIERFANGEIYCEISSSVRGADVFVIQSLTRPVNDNLMELLILIDALKRASANSITVVMPHYGYSRQDRKANPRSPITAKLVADILTTAGATRVITMELHTGQIQGFFNIPFDNLYSSIVFLPYLEKELLKPNTICVSPDAGGVERVRRCANKLKCEIAMINKRRTAKNEAHALNIVGDVAGKNCILIDDIGDTAGTLMEAIKVLASEGAQQIHVCATHPIFSPPALERIKNCQELSSIIVTDTVALEPEVAQVAKIKVLPTHKIFAKAIELTYKHDSINALFL